MALDEASSSELRTLDGEENHYRHDQQQQKASQGGIVVDDAGAGGAGGGDQLQVKIKSEAAGGDADHSITGAATHAPPPVINRCSLAAMGSQFEDVTATGLSPVIEKQLTKAMAQELNVFFTQVRVSGLVERLTHMLRVAASEEDSKPAEQFIFLCWTRHSHVAVQELMESTKQYVAERKYKEALVSLAEVCRPAFLSITAAADILVLWKCVH
jgi:hypothetical protein